MDCVVEPFLQFGFGFGFFGYLIKMFPTIVDSSNVGCVTDDKEDEYRYLIRNFVG